jgi:uncharacterized coiled-coil protein SlyX
MDADDSRLIDLEIKLSFLEEQVQTLSQALVNETRTNVALGERVTLLERALQILAARMPQKPKGEDVADVNHDHVPHSG